MVSDPKIEALKNSGSPLEMTQAVNNIAGSALGLSMVLIVFLISFYRLSPQGYIPAFTASSFTSTIFAFILASASLMPVEMPFLFAAASVASGAYMYMNQRA